MTTESPLAEGLHNHPPRCCCFAGLTPADPDRDEPCPACPEHGELAPGIECPQCHQPIGRPHTDFCTLAPGVVWDGALGELSPQYGAECLARKTLGITPHVCLLVPGHEGDHVWTADRGESAP